MKKFKPRLPPPPDHPKPPPSSAATKSSNALINRYSTTGAHRHVLHLYFTMLKTNILPDPYTYPSMLKACTSLNLHSHGLCFHQHAVVNGYSTDPYISASLINFYAKFGYPEVARKVFDVMPERNVVPWTAIIGCYSRLGEVNTSFQMYNQMQSEGVKPSSVTILTMLSRILEIIHIQSLHACAIRFGFSCDLVLANCMLNSYGKCGRVEDARSLFESMENRDIISWNSLISVYAMVVDHNVGEISQLLCRMCFDGVTPDHQTFGSLVSAATRNGNPVVGKLCHAKIVTNGFEMDLQVKTLLVTMYLKFNDLTNAFRLFERTLEKDMILWTAMISGLLQNDCPDRALAFFRRMLISNVMPSTTTVACALAACAHLGSYLLGASIHGYILRQKMLVDVPTQNSLITMYAKCGRLNQSCVVFETMSYKDVVTWNAMVSGYAQNGELSNALYVFNEMRKSFERPDSVTVVSLLQACASIGAYHQGKLIHSFIVRSCLGSTLLTDTALVDMYFKCGNVDTARRCFDGMPEHDVVSWSTLIGGYGSHGKGETALKMFSEFLQTGLEPNHVTFLSTLYACSHNGLVNEGLTLFKTMKTRFNIEPKLEHCACIVDLLCRGGRIEEAYEFYKMNFSKPVIDVLGILLDGCRAKGNKELGDVIATEMRRLKPEDAGNLVQLVHSYASSGRWDGVGEAWIKMRSLGLKKVPAWSFIEINGNFTSFFKDHNSHCEYDEIVTGLKSMALHLNPEKSGKDCLECEDDGV